MRNKGFWIVFGIYSVLFFVDLGMTLYHLHYLDYIEANPLYKISGSVIPIIILNLLILYGLFWTYHRPRTPAFIRFMMISAMTSVCIARLVAIRNAFYYVMHPVALEAAKEVITQSMKTEFISILGLLTYGLIIMPMINYAFWRIDHDVRKK